MMRSVPLHLFYEEPDPDRWFPGDRWPRRVVRRLVRGAPQPGGMMRYFLNLRAGLAELGVDVRVNDYTSLRRHPGAVAAVIGKHEVVAKIPADHPVVFGPAVPSHPAEQRALFARPNLRLTVLSSDWHAALYREGGVGPTAVWAAGIDTAQWAPVAAQPIATSARWRVLLYDKVRWEREALGAELLAAVRTALADVGAEVREFRYGHYREGEYRAALGASDAMVFLCEHETQGFAYLQALSAGVPLLAWDRGGRWHDPQARALGVEFGPVSSVPYWDARCGEKFTGVPEFPAALVRFRARALAGDFAPRALVEEHLTLAACARRYLELIEALATR